MCDFVDGQLILAAPSDGVAANGFLDWVIESAPQAGLPRLGNLYTVLEQADAHPGPAAESVRAELLGCAPGMEGRVLGRLYRLWAAYVVDHYPDRAGEELWLGRNHVLTGAVAPAGWELQEATDSPLGALANHVQATGTLRIAVLDSGISDPPGITLPKPGEMHNFVGPDRTSAADGLGHGTVIAARIAAIDSSITVDVLKVISDGDVATEFDVLAALASETVHDADVVNLSLAFGLQDANCGQCGDRHHSSMSDVFMYMLEKVADSGPIVVAAAGNHKAGDSPDPLCYPARFTGVVAVGALADDDTVLDISNVGVAPTDDHDKPTLVFAPGRAVLDRVDQDGTTTEITGTSIACAYVSAMLAVIKDVGGYGRQATIDSLAGAATKLTDHDDVEHGKGQVNWPEAVSMLVW